MERTGADERNALFKKISQLAIRGAEKQTTSKELLRLTFQLLEILQPCTETSISGLDEKLAEYVFFPLYHIFRQMEQYPMPLIENCLACLNILITCGWQSKIAPNLVQQIFSLLVFIIDGVPGTKHNTERPEETILESFRTQHALLTVVAGAAQASSSLATVEMMPALGHGVTTMLDHIVDGVNHSIQEEALKCISRLYEAIRDHAAIASFLPGTVSSLAKLLSSPSRYKNSTVSKSIDTLRVVLIRVLSDVRIKLFKQKAALEQKPPNEKAQILTQAWLDATASQIRLALAPVLKLRTYDPVVVQKSLERLCVSLLDECHDSLKSCAPLLVETAMLLTTDCSDAFPEDTNLSHIVGVYPELQITVKTTVYNAMLALSRAMQSSDENTKRMSIHSLSKGLDMLRSLNIESSTIEDELPSTIRDALATVFSKEQSSGTSMVDPTPLPSEHSLVLGSGHHNYSPLLFTQDIQKTLRMALFDLLRLTGSVKKPLNSFASVLEAIRDSPSSSQTASFWLCFEVVKAAQAPMATEDEFLNLSTFADESEDLDLIFDELYAYSVQVLDDPLDARGMDWRREAIALEVVAYSAQRSGVLFRPELIDVLFPIATFLGAQSPKLQEHAITTLNIVAAACDYSSVSELIIDNVDYMVNSISLRLTTLDISPASTQVLTMMIRLAGPRLIPFLDDVVDTIFAALENYHGYPAFVESLFLVLKEVVDQAVKSDVALLDQRERVSVNHRKQRAKVNNIESLLDFLTKRKKRIVRDEMEARDMQSVSGHPQRPWKSENMGDEGENDQSVQGDQSNEEKTANSPTYTLLNRVANLTQYYLTSPTPKLRRSLLELLTVSFRMLAADEDVFLPLAHGIWPVVIDRLYDSESFVVIEACHTLCGLCEAAGDFLSSRFKTEWYDRLGSWCRRAKQDATKGTTRTRYQPSPGIQTQNGGQTDITIPIHTEFGLEAKMAQVDLRDGSSGSLGQYASPARIWGAAVKLLTSMLSFVRIEDKMFDEMLELLVEVMERSPSVREALEVVNADAVWLARYERGLVDWMPTPKVSGMDLVDMQQL